MSLSGDVQLYRRVMQQARPHWGRIGAIFVLDLMGSPLGLLTPLPLKIAVDNAINGRPLPGFVRHALPAALGDSRSTALLIAAVLLIFIGILGQLQNLAGSLLRAYTTEKLVLDFRALIFRHMQRMSLAWHDSTGTADAIYRIQYDAPSIQYISIDGTIPFITSAVTLVTMFYVTTRIDWQLTLVAVAISPVLWWLSHGYRPRLRGQSREAKKQEHAAKGDTNP